MKATHVVQNLRSLRAATLATLLWAPFSADAQAISGITDLILITGQSNVTGSRTNFDPQIDTVDVRVFAYTDTNDWEVADLHQAWDVDGVRPGNGSLNPACLADPNCTPSEPYNHFAFHFAKTVVENDPGRIVGIIVASAPGKGILHWDANSTFTQTIQSKVIAALNAQGVKSSLDGILWHQGETDHQFFGTSDVNATPEEKSDDPYYQKKLTSLIQRLRAESWFGSDKPFICGETKKAPVNGRLMALNSDNDPWTGCVVGHDLPTREMDLTTDPQTLGTHFSTEGLRTLGQRYGYQYLNMTSTTKHNPNPEVTVHTSCLAGNGRVDVNLTNKSSHSSQYQVAFGNLQVRSRTVPSKDWARVPFTGRLPGTYSLVVYKDSKATIADSTITIDCSIPTPPLSTPEVSPQIACRNGLGQVFFQFVNPTAQNRSYIIEFASVANRSTTAAPFGQSRRGTTGRPDGVYNYTIRTNSPPLQIDSGTVTVDCS